MNIRQLLEHARSKRILRLSGGLALLLFVGLLTATWLQQDNVVVGRVVSVHPIPSRGAKLVILDKIAADGSRVAILTPEAATGALHSWIMAKGEKRSAGDWTVYFASEVVPARMGGWIEAPQRLEELNIDGSASDIRFPFIIGGILAALLGRLFIRIVGGLSLAIPVGYIAWLKLLSLQIVEGTAASAIVISIFVVTFAAAYRSLGVFGFILQRVGMAAAVWFFSPTVASAFGWPLEIVQPVGAIGAMLMPAIGLWLFSSTLIVVGLGAGGETVHLILGAVALGLHVFNRSVQVARLHSVRTPSGLLRLAMLPFKRRESQSKYGEIPLDNLVAA